MRKIYVVTDNIVKADILTFLESNDGSASSFFYVYCLQRGHRDFSLSSIGIVDFTGTSYEVVDVNRDHVMDMPPEDEND